MTVTVGELMGWLEEMDEDAEVKLAHQPSWPFEYSVDSFDPVVKVDGASTGTEDGGGVPVVYLVEGS